MVSRRPSANGRFVAVTVKRMSVTAGRSRLSWNVPKLHVTLLAAGLAIAEPGTGPPIGGCEKVSVGPKLQ